MGPQSPCCPGGFPPHPYSASLRRAVSTREPQALSSGHPQSRVQGSKVQPWAGQSQGCDPPSTGPRGLFTVPGSVTTGARPGVKPAAQAGVQVAQVGTGPRLPHLQGWRGRCQLPPPGRPPGAAAPAAPLGDPARPGRSEGLGWGSRGECRDPRPGRVPGQGRTWGGARTQRAAEAGGWAEVAGASPRTSAARARQVGA